MERVNSFHFPSASLELMAPRNVPSQALKLLVRDGSSRLPQPFSPQKPNSPGIRIQLRHTDLGPKLRNQCSSLGSEPKMGRRLGWRMEKGVPAMTIDTIRGCGWGIGEQHVSIPRQRE